MKAFGIEFQHIDDSHIEDLLTLEREKAVYSDYWIEELGDFRHVRIQLADDEIAEYVRSMRAYDMFLGSSATRAMDVPSIPADIAARADAYATRLTDSGDLMGDRYCAAGFMGDHLEFVLCFSINRVQIIEEQGATALLSTITRVVDALTPVIRYLTAREKGLPEWPICREDDIRDLLYAMLRGSISDIRLEEPIPSKGGTSKVVDLFSRVARTLIEVKWIAKPHGWKRILEEINDDIQTYGRHPECAHLLFVVIDAVKAVQDPRLVEEQLTGEQVIDGKKLSVKVYVRET